MHLSDEEAQRLLHRELPTGEELRIRQHLDECGPCRAKLDEAERKRREVEDLLAVLDDPPPRIDAATLMARAEAGSRHRALPGWLRQAAAVLLVLGVAGIVYALPGSPVRKWVRGMIEKASQSPPTGGRPGSSGVLELGAGISVPPEQGLAIVFLLGEARGDGQLFVRLTDGPDVEVHARAGAATFASSPGRLEVRVQGESTPFQIGIPRSAPLVEIRGGREVLFSKEGALISTGASSGPDGTYVLPLKHLSSP